jgi:hypothetical protein
MKKHYRAENDCLNCGATLQGKFCHVCGQENLEIKESFGHLMNHAVSDYFHFDDKFFNTLKPLLFKPGKLTNEYMAGKRASYLHPVKMYIFISFIYFVLLFSDKVQTSNIPAKPITNEQTTKADSIVAKNPNLTDEQKKDIYNTYNYIIVKDKNGKGNDTVYHGLQGMTKITKDTSYSQYLLNQSKLPAGKRDGFLTKLLVKKVFHLKKQENGSNTLMETFYHDAPKMMFLLLPIFALILKVTFRKNHKFYVEHLIYSFHLHCFIFLLLTFFMLVELAVPASWDFVNIIAFILIVWYVYRSLRVVYNRSPGRTITKMIGITVSYMVALIFCMISLFAIIAAIEL